ncbi:MAG: hypothetical protein COB60_09055 [Flavobacteriaceae bacterium]|nr:MAG: hypothetical protein COB60_09055 [Flavobacteriaceae bacterium]
MDNRVLKWLYDIKMAIDEIDAYFVGKEMDFFEYRKNTMLKRAVERDIEIIGEAVNRILKKDKIFASKISDAKAIISLINQVIHSYDSISDENIWSIIINHIPKLKQEVELLINNTENL